MTEQPIYTLPVIAQKNASVFTSALVEKLVNAIWTNTDDRAARAVQISSVNAWLEELNPQDGVETMLATQLILVHNTLMNCLQRANSPKSFGNFKESLNQSNKLTRSFVALIETLNHYRGKSSTEQKITVQYVNVAHGGQAIVGDVASPQVGGRVKNKE